MQRKSSLDDSAAGPGGHFLQYGRGVALVFEFTGTVAAGFLVGYLADARLGTDPWMMIVGTVVAVVGGFIRLVQVVRRLDAVRSDRKRSP